MIKNDEKAHSDNLLLSKKNRCPAMGDFAAMLDARYFPCLTCSLGPPVARSARTCWSRWFASWRMEPWIYQPLGGFLYMFVEKQILSKGKPWKSDFNPSEKCDL